MPAISVCRIYPDYTVLPPRMRPAGSRGQAQTPPRGAWRPPLARPEAGPGSPAPRPARPNIRRATGGCGWEKRESERRCSVSGGWADAGREGRGGGPPFKPVRCSLSGSSPLALATWLHGARLVTLLPFGPVPATASSSSSPLVLSWRRPRPGLPLSFAPGLWGAHRGDAPSQLH